MRFQYFVREEIHPYLLEGVMGRGKDGSVLFLKIACKSKITS